MYLICTCVQAQWTREDDWTGWLVLKVRPHTCSQVLGAAHKEVHGGKGKKKGGAAKGKNKKTGLEKHNVGIDPDVGIDPHTLFHWKDTTDAWKQQYPQELECHPPSSYSVLTRCVCFISL